MNLYSSNLGSTNKDGPISANGSSKISKKRSSGGGQSATLGARENTRGITSFYAASSPLGDVEDSLDFCAGATPDFDMGTCWGKTERSKVKTVEFERGCLAQSFDIYYASRESLIKMGVPIESGLSTNLPQSFPNKYCVPPKGYIG